MGKPLNLVGERFGRLLVQEREGTDAGGNSTWWCLCLCGNRKVVDAQSLRNGGTKSCGCLRLEGRKAKDRVGEKFGKLTILERIKGGYRCECECGQTTEVEDPNWGIIKSCSRSCGAEKLPTGVAARNAVLLGYKRQATATNREWGISDKRFFELTQCDCHYCGRKPSSVSTCGKTTGAFVYNGIDRKDNVLGYIEGNVLPCCGFCNRLKRHHPYEDFMAFILRAGTFQLQNATIRASI